MESEHVADFDTLVLNSLLKRRIIRDTSTNPQDPYLEAILPLLTRELPSGPLDVKWTGWFYKNPQFTDEGPERYPDESSILFPHLPEPPQLPPSTASSLDLESCREALEQLRRVYCLPFTKCRNWLDFKSGVYIWPGVIPGHFIELIYDRAPEAMVVLAQYCALMKKINSCWYFEGVGKAMLDEVQEILRRTDEEQGLVGDESWSAWIRWAVEQPLE